MVKPNLRGVVKLIPAAITCLLSMTWVMSNYREYWIDIPAMSFGRYLLQAEGGLFRIGFHEHPFPLGLHSNRRQADSRGSMGQFGHEWVRNADGSLYRCWWGAPIACLITAMLPFAIGPFMFFRFRLWHYLAYTALVAVELAYYLRWQA